MAEQFYTILTKVGKAKIANANALGTKLNLAKFVLGDGNGSYYNPIEDQTNVKNKVWEGLINSISIDKDNPNWILINTVIPATIGGFMIREAGLFDTEGNMIAIGKYPETYKPVVSEGSAKDLYINMIIEVSNTQNVTLKVDPTVILANKKDIEILSNRIDTIKFPVTSINTKKGDVVLKAEDIKTSNDKTVEEEIKIIKDDMKDKDLKSFETDVLMTNLKDCNGGFVGTELYGRTLVNLSKFTSIYTNANGNIVATEQNNLTTGRTVTIINNTGKVLSYGITGVGESSFSETVKTITLAQDKKINYVFGMPANGWTEQNKNDLLKVMVLDGEVKTAPNQSFEGMKHVGEEVTLPDGTKVYRIENLSKGKNLVPSFNSTKWSKSGNSNVTVVNDSKFTVNATSEYYGMLTYIDVEPNTIYTLSCSKETRGAYVTLGTQSGAPLGHVGIFPNRFATSFNTGAYNRIYIYCVTWGTGSTGTFTFENVQLEKGIINNIVYEEPRENKTEILSPTPWRQGDSQDVNGVKTIGSGEVILNGSENWSLSATNVNTIRFNYIPPDRKLNTTVICDKFKALTTTPDEESIIGGATIAITINKSRLTGYQESWTDIQKVTAFKTLLATLLPTVVYQLATPIKENTNKTLISKGFPNGYFQCNAGPVQPHIKGTYATNMGERVESIEETVDELQEDVQDLQSAMIVVSGAIVDLNSKTKTLSEKDISLEQRIEDLSKQIADMKNSIWIRQV